MTARVLPRRGLFDVGSQFSKTSLDVRVGFPEMVFLMTGHKSPRRIKESAAAGGYPMDYENFVPVFSSYFENPFGIHPQP